MSLRPGSRIGPFEVSSALGAGGMGEVYLATDTNLGRRVAIKVLPDAFAHDPERLSRFEREARALAALNHPSIAQIYGVESGALVMEFVEGDDLAQRLARGPMPIDDVLPIALQIAEALEAAHQQGIIHRDLKPANIKVTTQGKVKVLDFGLAKLASPEPSSSAARPSALSMSPTIVSPAAMTGVGMLLGTAAYMSPEQAKGRDADMRSDVWAFGCVLFEMLTGRRAFDGEDVADALVAVLSKEPDWAALSSEVPASIRTLLRRCLQRDRSMRLQAIGDARVELHETLHLPPAAAATEPHGVSHIGRRTAIAVGIGSLLVGLVVGIPAAWRLQPAPAPPLVHLGVPLPTGEILPFTQASPVAVAPDGSRVAFIAARGGVRHLYLRALTSGDATPIAASEGADSPFFSPDGQWLGFVAGGNLMKVAVGGGAPLILCRAEDVRGVSWGDDGSIVFAPTFGTDGLFAVPDTGGQPRSVAPRDDQSKSEALRWPQVLSTRNLLLYSAWTRNIDDAEIVAQRLDTGEKKVVVRGGTHPRLLPSGELVYVQSGAVIAVPFDASRLETTGKPVPVMQGVSMTAEGAGQFDVAAAGSLIFVPGDVQGSRRTLAWVDRAGREQPIDAPPRLYQNPRLSPDGKRIALGVSDATDDLFIFDTERRTLSRLTSGARSLGPVWTADGKRIVYRSARDGRLNLFVRNADGTGDEERLTVSQANHNPLAVSPDGQIVVFAERGVDLWMLRLNGDRTPAPVARSPFREVGAAISPDGAWIAYSSDDTGRAEIYAQPFPGGGPKVPVSRDGGTSPRWTTAGEIVYRSGSRMMAVRALTRPTLTIGQPQVLFDGPQYAETNFAYDVTADGQRLLMMKEDDRAGASSRIDLVLNWTRELHRLVPH